MSKGFQLLSSRINKIEGWLNAPVVSILYRLSRAVPERGNIVEIGSWKGKSTALFALSKKNSVRVTCIDPFTGSSEHKASIEAEINTYPEFKENMQSLGVFSELHILKKKSQDAYQELQGIAIDLLWIDGSHEYKDVREDLSLYLGLVKEGGVVAMHDYKWPGVKAVTWELLNAEIAGVGLVFRTEDTHYFKKNSQPSALVKLLNRLRLIRYKQSQALKRFKRKLKKKVRFRL